MTIDVVDATEPDDEAEVKTIRGAGIDPIVMAGMSGAVEQVVENIIRRAAALSAPVGPGGGIRVAGWARRPR